MKTHCADVSLPRKFQPSVYYMNRVQSPTCSKAPMGQIARVETLPLSLTSRAAQPTRPPSLIHRGDRPRTAGNFSLLFSLFSLFFIPPPFSSSFPFLLSFSLFFSLARLDVSVLFGAQQGARATLAIYIFLFWKKRRGSIFQRASESSSDPRSVAEKGWRGKEGRARFLRGIAR